MGPASGAVAGIEDAWEAGMDDGWDAAREAGADEGWLAAVGEAVGADDVVCAHAVVSAKTA